MSFRPLKQLVTLIFLGVNWVSLVNGASATTLLLPSADAFSFLGRSCGGIQEQSFASGFDQNGDVLGEVYLQTHCGGSGRGGGYTTHTYSAWVGLTWDVNGNVITDAAISAPSPDPGIAGAYHSGGLVGGANFPNCNNATPFDNAFTCSSNSIFSSDGQYSIQNTLYVINQASCTTTNTSYCTYRAVLTPAAVPIPATIWLFLSGLIGSSFPSLIKFNSRKYILN